MSLILDSSATLAWVYGDEVTEAICQVFETISREGAWVPALWRLEVGNVLEMGVRRGRHDAAFRPEADRQAWGRPHGWQSVTD